MKSLKILQTNLGRSRAAHDMAEETAARNDVDIIVVSEPNRRVLKKAGWLKDKRGDVGVYFRNRKLELRQTKAGEGYICIHMAKGALICCYSSPNIALGEFEEEVHGIMREVQGAGECIVMGDLNVKSPLWGSPVTDKRGEHWTEWMAALDLVVLNVGNKPTFIRGRSESHIDITCATQQMAKRVVKWEVLDDETMTDHQFIQFEIQKGKKYVKGLDKKKTNYDWEVFKIALSWLAKGEQEYGTGTTSTCTKVLKKSLRICQEAGKSRDKVPYWWNSDIENKRAECLAARRRITRAARRTQEEREIKELRAAYKVMKKELRRKIRDTKMQMWKELCDDLDRDIWGDGYKIVTKRIGGLRPYELTMDKKWEIARELFPEIIDDHWKDNKETTGVPTFTMEELKMVMEKTKSGKAPGLDGIPMEAIKETVSVFPEWILGVLNNVLQKQEFPKCWKVARLVLLPKVATPGGSPSAYRPLCLLNTISKVFESLIKRRLEEELAEVGDLSENQFGFRKGRSTIQAVEAVIQYGRREESRWSVLVTLDVKNAFNTVVWSNIMRELQNKGVSRNFVNIIESYLSERRIEIGRGNVMEVKAGVPQGSVLGPLLWNILYDGVLRLELTEGAKQFAFADDLAVVVRAEDEDELVHRVDQSLHRIDIWMRANALELAPGKTEAVIMKGPRRRVHIRFHLRDKEVMPSRAVRYLGIKMDDKGNYKEHLCRVVRKAERRVTALGRILPNIGGPSNKKRRLLNGVVHSTILYGAPIWVGAMRVKKYRDMVLRVQRKMLIRVASAYRTVSGRAVQVITGVPPLNLLAEERGEAYRRRQDGTAQVGGALEEDTMTKWQEEWDRVDQPGLWTKRLIPDISEWVRCKHREVNYWMTQMLSGHGSFRAYVKKIGKTENDSCIYCGEIDTAEHALFTCRRFDEVREQAVSELGRALSVNSLASIMTRSKRNWILCGQLMRSIMEVKASDESRV